MTYPAHLLFATTDHYHPACSRRGRQLRHVIFGRSQDSLTVGKILRLRLEESERGVDLFSFDPHELVVDEFVPVSPRQNEMGSSYTMPIAEPVPIVCHGMAIAFVEVIGEGAVALQLQSGVTFENVLPRQSLCRACSRTRQITDRFQPPMTCEFNGCRAIVEPPSVPFPHGPVRFAPFPAATAPRAATG